MPEGPEIRLAADDIARAIEGQTIQKVEVGIPDLKSSVMNLVDSKVREVETRGKALLIHFENNVSVYSHNQLYGVWFVVDREQYPTTKRQLRLALHTHKKSALLYSASDIRILSSDNLLSVPLLKKLGPDVMSEHLTPSIIQVRLLLPQFVNRSLSSLFLDQGFIAGLGNYLRTEILFFAGLHPDQKPRDLTSADLELLSLMTLDVSQRSYHTRGYTVLPELREQLEFTGLDYESIRFMTFNREQEPCRICSTPIEKIIRTSRRLYFCPLCQARK